MESGGSAEPQLLLKDEEQQAAILRELERIRNSRAFRNSERSKQFLSYVVEHALQGQTASLKERTIGVDLFHRSPTYPTGDDPVVRLKAGDVRRRLAQYYAEEERAPEIRIEIPVGSYIPEFHRSPPADPIARPAAVGAVLRRAARSNIRIWEVSLAVVVVALLVTALVRRTGSQPRQLSALNEFWAPLFTTPQPVLICIASPVVYTPSLKLFSEASRAHPGQYDTQVQQFNAQLQLDPNATLKWKDIVPRVDIYVNKDDASVAARLSNLFARIHKVSQVRAGHSFSYDDLRNSPAVLVGAFNNNWTMRTTAELPFVFREQNDIGWIQESGTKGKAWRPGRDAQGNIILKDFAIVARLLNSKTGQFLVIVAGVGMVGTEAAGAFVSRESTLEAGLNAALSGWQKKNVEVVLESDVIDGAAGPPHVVAAAAW
jgi:hypothetical protein